MKLFREAFLRRAVSRTPTLGFSVAVSLDSSRTQNSLSESVTFGSTREVTKTISMGRRQGLVGGPCCYLILPSSRS
jgi:hypothetical protein